MIRVGIIGCGQIAQKRHIPEYINNDFSEIIGYYDINFKRAKDLASLYGGKAYKAWEDLLSNETIDAVSVCTSNDMHACITVEALRANKHVLCEKPMAMTFLDCKNMVDEADKNGKILMIDHNQRLAKAHQLAKKLLEAGEIGKLLSFRTTFGHGGPESWSIDPGKDTWFFKKDKSVVGVAADLGVHKLDLVQYLTGQNIVDVSARLVTLDKRDSSDQLIEVDDNAICICTLDNGAIGTIIISWTYYGPEDNSTILYGNQGIMLIYDDPSFSVQVFKSNGERIFYDTDRIQTNDNQTNSGVVDEFISCIENKRESELSGRKILNSMKAVFAVVESSKTGKVVKL